MPENQQTALIIGASRGLGLGLAREYLDRGWRVIATSRGPSDLDALACDRLQIEPLDVTREDQTARLSERLRGRSLDLLFVNAGVNNSRTETMAEVSTDEFVRVMVTNTLAPLRLLDAFADTVGHAGVLAVMSSGLGSVGNNTSGGYEVYRASKAALNIAVRSFAARHPNATVLTFAPGWVRTDMGGDDASLDVGTSVRGLADVIASRAGRPGHAYLDYKGAAVPW